MGAAPTRNECTVAKRSLHARPKEAQSRVGGRLYAVALSLVVLAAAAVVGFALHSRWLSAGLLAGNGRLSPQRNPALAWWSAK